MRRLFVLSVLFGIMAAVEILKVQGTVLSGHITLAAIGFVVLASFTMSELGSTALKLPKVTGYIIAGIVLGPQLTNILSSEAVDELRMFNTLALGLIALNAGLELSVKSMAKIARTLASTICAKILLLPVFVGGSLYLAGRFLPDWTGMELSHGHLVALCLIFSALAIGTSPAIAIAVSSELKAKGKLTDLVLGNAIFKDLVVVIVLAIAIAVSKTLINHDATLGVDVITMVMKELGLSIALGLACGLIIIAYTHFISFQMLLFVIVLILAASEISTLLHTELLLVFITAGFVVRNFSDFEHEVLDPLEKVALPTFVVFFTIAGASIDMINSLKVLPVAGILFVARGVSYYLAAKAGGKIGRESPEIKKYAWLGYIPQAGVTLGLIGIAANQLTDLGPTISHLGMTIVALNLLVGPVTLRLSLKGAGEIPEEKKTLKPAPSNAIQSSENLTLETIEIENATEADIVSAIGKISDSNLRQIVARVDMELHKTFNTHIQKSFRDWQVDLLKSFEAIIVSSQSNFKLAEEIQDWARLRRDQPQAVLLDSIVIFRNSLNKHIESLHYTEPATFEEHHYKARSGDGFPTRLRKIRLRVRRLFSSKLTRKVPLRALLKIHILDALSTWSNEAVKGVIHSETKVYKTIKDFTDSKTDKDSILPEAKVICSYLIDSIKGDFTNFLARTYEHLSGQLNDAGSPELPTSKIRVSDIEPRLEALNEIFDEVLEHARDMRTLSLSGLALSSAQRIINLKLNHLINESVVKKISETTQEYETVISDIRTRIEGVKNIANELTNDSAVTSLVSLKKAIDTTIDQPLTNKLDRLAADLSYELSVHKLAIQLKKIAYSGGGTFIVQEQTGDGVVDPGQKIKKIEVDLQSILDECLVDDLIPEIEASVQSYKDFAGGIRTVTEQIAKVLSFSLENDSTSPEISTIKGSTIEGVESAYSNLNDYVKELQTVTEQVTDHILENYYQVLDKIEELTYSRSLSRSARERFLDIRERLELLLAKYRHYKPVGAFLNFIRYTQEIPDDLKSYFKNAKASIGRELVSDAKYGDKDMLKRLSNKLVPRLEASSLPPLFRKGFSLTPVKDRRFFIANNDVLKDILDTERDWMAGQNTGGRLIIGESGGGKTSIINICQLELKTERVYRTDPNRIPARGSLLHWIARNVNAPSSLEVIERALRKEKSVVLVDNLEQWISPTPQGIGELKSLLELMSRTSRSVFWIVTVTKEFYQYYANVLGLDLPFGRSLSIEKLSVATLHEVIANRLAYSGIKVNYKQTMAGSWLHRIRLGNDEDIYFRILAKFSYGNIRAALAMWINSINFNSDKSATPSIVSLLDSRFPYKDYLPDEYQTILLNLLRHGAMRERELSANLQWGHERIFKILHKLAVSGQIYRTDDLTNQYEIYESLKIHISQALQQSK